MLRPLAQTHQLLPIAFCCETSLLAISQHAKHVFDTLTDHDLISHAVFTSCQLQSLRCYAILHSSFNSTSNRRSHTLERYYTAVGVIKTTNGHGSWHQQLQRQLLLSVPHSHVLGYIETAQGAAMQQRGIAASSEAGTSEEDVLSGANLKARAITRSMRDALDLQQLQEIVEQQGSSFNAIHVAAAFTKTAKLAGGSTVDTTSGADSTTGGSTSAGSAGSSVGSMNGGSTASCAGSTSVGSTASNTGSPVEVTGNVLQLLAPIWQHCLQEAAPRELASVLYACARLICYDHLLWDSTLSTLTQPQNLQKANAQDLSTAAYAVATAAGTLLTPSTAAAAAAADGSQDMRILAGQNAAAVVQTLAMQLTTLLRNSTAAGEASCQSVSYVLWALAKLGCSVAESEVVVLLQALAQRKQLAAADVQAIASSLWAVSQMHQLSTAARQPQQSSTTQPHSQTQLQQKQQTAGSQDVWGQLLRDELIQQIAQGSSQAVSNTLLALARLSCGARHPVSVPVAQHCAEQLLSGNTAKQLNKWNAQDICSSMWACAKLGIRDLQLFEQAAASAEVWLPDAMAPMLSQVAWACAKLKYRNQQFVEGIMQQGRHLMHRDHGQAPLLPHHTERTALAATLSWMVATLNMTQLAGDIKAIISASGVKQQEEPLTAVDARALWRVHGWLQHNQLLGGHGLSKLLTEQQLASCAEASRHAHRHAPPPHVAARLQQQQQQ